MDDKPKVWKLQNYADGEQDQEHDYADPQTAGDLWAAWSITKSDDFGYILAVAKAGQHVFPHAHPDSYSYATVVRGRALMWVDGTVYVLDCGDTIYVPKDMLHDFGAADDSECWVLDLTLPQFDPAKMVFAPDREQEIAAAFEEARQGMAQPSPV